MAEPEVNEIADPTAEDVEDTVMNTLPTLNAVELEAVCGVVNIALTDEQKGKKRQLLKLVMKYLCTETEEETKMADFLAVHLYGS